MIFTAESGQVKSVIVLLYTVHVVGNHQNLNLRKKKKVKKTHNLFLIWI